MYVFKTLSYGGRIEVVEISILYLFVVFDFFKNQKFLFYIGIFLSILLLKFFAVLRFDPDLIFSFDYIIDDYFLQKDIVSSQYGDVFQSSLRVLGLLQDGIFSAVDRIYSFVLVLFGAILPSAFMPDVYNLSTYRQDYASSGGGGLISAFSYIWISYFGPVLFGFFTGFIVRMLFISSNFYIHIYSFMVLVSVPRWFAYYPVGLFKFCFLAVFLTYFYNMFRKRPLNNNYI
jgi:hypothetical protein